MSFQIIGDFILAPFPVMVQLALDCLNYEYTKWQSEKHQIAERHHEDVEEAFNDLLVYLLNIRDDDQSQVNFSVFDRRVYLLTRTIELFKEE